MLYMVTRSEIKEEIDVLEIINTGGGKWYIAQGIYNDTKKTVQGESRDESIRNLVNKFYKHARREEQRKERQKRNEKMLERNKKYMENRINRAESYL